MSLLDVDYSVLVSYSLFSPFLVSTNTDLKETISFSVSIYTFFSLSFLMEDQAKDHSNPSNHSSNNTESDRNEPVRSRWTPKPEQILILESIFNSGMVNPPKDETIRIRKLLEKFGSVGDANVFYWFQNRRSRSRRRQRQIQANLSGGGGSGSSGGSGGGIQYDQSGGGFSGGVMGFPLSGSSSTSSPNCGVVRNDCGADNIFSFSGQICHPQNEQTSSSVTTSTFNPTNTIDFQYLSGFITVFINGVAREVPRGPLDLKEMLGQNYVLVHSSGVPLPVNEFGFLSQGLQHGESYFVVPRAF